MNDLPVLLCVDGKARDGGSIWVSVLAWGNSDNPLVILSPTPIGHKTLFDIRGMAQCPLVVGGYIQNFTQAQQLLDLGIDYVAVDPEAVASWEEVPQNMVGLVRYGTGCERQPPEMLAHRCMCYGAKWVLLYPVLDHALPPDMDTLKTVAESIRIPAAVITSFEKDGPAKAVFWRDR